ncbi:uncharacterized protein N7473_000874 [Penicillium subrubescens]|uniref:uncharacterized protein n=1 Tax=Penicillium subrubescens TaxID=1316194 RepID=UPI002544D6A8|nr:uncharacterized protein N7473_000874 [Penicillium subrubescens]KAJ5911571.1 hypothetical protein N7473_000874 [Penicillium subrubescens]
MSGIEIIGVVASIVQIADLGGRLSVKLCTFCHKFKNANKALRYLSKDVALTCNVLRQLGESLGQDDLASLYSPDAFETAQDVLKECEQVFQDLESAIEQHYPDPNSQSRIDKMARKLKFLINESQLETVAGNLERLKSTMLLMLNVVIYAGQIRSRRETHELQEQRNLLLILTSEKIESERNYERLTRTLQFTSLTETTSNMENPIGVDQPDETKDELYHYCQMVKSVLDGINAVQSLLDRDRYRRVKNGFVSLHRSEALMFRHSHGQSALDIFRTQIPDSFRIEASSTPAQATTQMNQNQQPSIPLSPILNQANAISPSSMPPEIAELSLEQIRERVMQVAREFQSSRQAQQASGQHDLSHQQSQIQTLRILQARAMHLQREQMQSLMQSRPASQAPPMPNMQMSGMPMQQQPMQNKSAPAMAHIAQMQAQIQQRQMQAQATQNKSAPPLPQIPQMQSQMQQQQMQSQMQSRLGMQASATQQMQQTSANLNNINQLSNQPRGLYRRVPPDSFNTGQPDPPPQYTPPMRSQSQVPAYNMAPQAQASPPKPPFPLAQSTESNIRQSSTGLGVPVARTSDFYVSYGSDEPDHLENFDFDSFLNKENDHTEQSKSDQVSSEPAPSRHEKKDVQPDQSTPLEIPKKNNRKRKVNATFSADDNVKPQTNPDTTREEGKSKRIQLDPSSSGDESSSTVLLPPTVSAGTEAQNQPSAAMNDQSSASNDASIETLDAWILRWTKLEQTELK